MDEAPDGAPDEVAAEELRDGVEDDVLDGTPEEQGRVQAELDRLRGLVGDLSLDDLRSGNWFAELLTHALRSYATKVDAQYLRSKYRSLPPDVIVAARIQLAARYAAIEGGLSAAAYTGVVAATIGTGGAASPLTLPAAGTSFVLDLAYTTQLQLRLAWDIAVLYGVPLDLDDVEDQWKLIRIAFVIQAGEAGRVAVGKGVPMFLRPLVKKIFSGGTLAAAKSLPVIGKHLLQRNIVKFSIPVVGVPLSAGVNYWSTRVAGAHARKQFRVEGRIVEAARRMTDRTAHPDVLLWVLWMTAKADTLMHENERALLRHVALNVSDLGTEAVALAELERTIALDRDQVWLMLATADGDLTAVYEAAVVASAVDGKTNVNELRLLKRLAEECGSIYDERAIRELAKDWAQNL